eukprot:c14723_g1_i2.p1 GENE.c14723_g1_i2~~c14723_g1_i2.p1  ORF type:complete len:524 (+),score=112.96 c14723_g1_i2:223-1794(+)
MRCWIVDNMQRVNILGLLEAIKAFDNFFSEIFASIIESALALHDLLATEHPNGIDVLRSGHSRTLELSPQLVRSILATQFLLIFPDSQDSFAMPARSNFKELHCQTRASSISKLKMFLNYFASTAAIPHRADLVFRRVFLEAPPKFEDSNAPLLEVQQVEGPIEDTHDITAAQVNFANRSIGGGVLGSGSLQEEIRFCMFPELTVAIVLCEKLQDLEALVVEGALRFNRYSGYGSKLEFVPGTCAITNAPPMIAIDAVQYSSLDLQLNPRYLTREMVKAFAGFSHSPVDTIATGNWGCGAFGGDVGIKALIQWVAASQAGKKLEYHPFSDRISQKLRDGLERLSQGNMTVGSLATALTHLHTSLPRAEIDKYTDASPEFFSIILKISNDIRPLIARSVSAAPSLKIQVARTLMKSDPTMKKTTAAVSVLREPVTPISSAMHTSSTGSEARSPVNNPFLASSPTTQFRLSALTLHPRQSSDSDSNSELRVSSNEDEVLGKLAGNERGVQIGQQQHQPSSKEEVL